MNYPAGEGFAMLVGLPYETILIADWSDGPTSGLVKLTADGQWYFFGVRWSDVSQGVHAFAFYARSKRAAVLRDELFESDPSVFATWGRDFDSKPAPVQSPMNRVFKTAAALSTHFEESWVLLIEVNDGDPIAVIGVGEFRLQSVTME